MRDAYSTLLEAERRTQVEPRMNRTFVGVFPSRPVTKHDVTKVPPVLYEDTGIAMVLDEMSRNGRILSRKS